MKIAVDVMGGDLGPEPLIKGCVEFVRNTDTKVIIVGDEKITYRVLKETEADMSRIEIAHTTQYVGMEDRISKVLRRKKLASIGIAARLVKSGYCDGLFTIGNTGGVISWSNVILKKIKGIKKTALCAVIPYPGGITVLVDSGASIRCTGENLAHFAVMGDVLAKKILGLENPRIGLLNIAEEEGKGKFKIQRAHHHLQKMDLHYIGFIEGNDLTSGSVDVAVCDGFVGNVLLKFSEGYLRAFKKYGEVAAEIDKNYIRLLGSSSKRVSSLNAAPLLGVNGVVMVGHGASNSTDFESGLNITRMFIQSGTVKMLRERFINRNV